MSHVAFNIGDRWKIITRATNKKHAQCSCPKAQRRATKEYYPPHLTGHGSRGLGPLDMMLFGIDCPLFGAFSKRNTCSNPQKRASVLVTVESYNIRIK